MFDTLIPWLRLNREATKHRRTSNVAIREAISDINADRARSVAMRYTRGNVSIQNGDFVTAEDIDRTFGKAPWRSKI